MMVLRPLLLAVVKLGQAALKMLAVGKEVGLRQMLIHNCDQIRMKVIWNMFFVFVKEMVGILNYLLMEKMFLFSLQLMIEIVKFNFTYIILIMIQIQIFLKEI